MKKTVKKTVFIISGICAALGIVFCTAGYAKGGSVLRALQNSGFIMEFEPVPERGSMNPYGGSTGGDLDDMYDFFREFGMSEDDIEDFLMPFGGNQGGRGLY